MPVPIFSQPLLRLHPGFFAAIGFILLTTSNAVLACQIPVFRYALERWQPDAYEVVVVHRGPLSREHARLVRQLRNSAENADAPLNLKVQTIDLNSASMDAAALVSPADLPKQQTLRWLVRDGGPPKLPWLRIHFPATAAGCPLACAGPLDLKTVQGLMDSPARREIAKRLLNGGSAVWVLIESGDAKRDEAAATTLRNQLKRLEGTLEMPTTDDLRGDKYFREETKVPLRLNFAIVRIGRDDPAEHLFVAMLINSEEGLDAFQEPIAIPIFGRGRSYYALVGRGINAETIEENCRFLVGACSCQVKQENPGADMLLAVNWAKHVAEGAPPAGLEALTGLGPLETERNADGVDRPAVAPGASAQPQSDVASVVLGAAAVGGTSASTVDESGGVPLSIGIVAVVLLGVLVGVVGTAVMKSKSANKQ